MFAWQCTRAECKQHGNANIMANAHYAILALHMQQLINDIKTAREVKYFTYYANVRQQFRISRIVMYIILYRNELLLCSNIYRCNHLDEIFIDEV